VRTVALGSALRRNAAKTDALKGITGHGGEAAGDEIRRQTAGLTKGSTAEALSGRGAVSVAVEGHVATRGEVEDTGGRYFEVCLR
jgi:hypothetical protein